MIFSCNKQVRRGDPGHPGDRLEQVQGGAQAENVGRQRRQDRREVPQRRHDA